MDLTLEGIVHDLNNVLETIAEAAELLSADPKWTRLSATIQRSVGRGRDIVTSLAESRKPVDLAQIVHDAIEFTRDYLAATRLPQPEFVRRVEEDLPLRGTPGAWERVMMNLFLNAAQASGGGLIEVEARRFGSRLEIAIADNGPGIPADVLPRIFDPHFSTKASPGLGLHIVRSLVSLHGGEVAAFNRSPEPGAVFRITVPAG